MVKAGGRPDQIPGGQGPKQGRRQTRRQTAGKVRLPGRAAAAGIAREAQVNPVVWTTSCSDLNRSWEPVRTAHIPPIRSQDRSLPSEFCFYSETYWQVTSLQVGMC